MAKTNLERYNDTIDYIRMKVDNNLATKVVRKVQGRGAELGKLIALAGSGGHRPNWASDQDRALRALLLCQNLFLKPGQINNATTLAHFKFKSVSTIKDAILIYIPKPLVTLDEFQRCARSLRYEGATINNPLTLTRKSVKFSGGITNCYGSVNMWLLKSGCCSYDWFINEGCNAYTVNRIIGDGEIVTMDQLPDIPEGWVFNIHDSVDKNICHWGVVLEKDEKGVKWAAAANTAPGAIDPATRKEVVVQFRRPPTDNAGYGHFTLESAVKVCKAKYTSGNVVLKALDPTRSHSYY